MALEVGVAEESVNIIEEDNRDKSCQEVAYQVTEKIGQHLVPKRAIYKYLQKIKPKEVLKLKMREIKEIHNET